MQLQILLGITDWYYSVIYIDMDIVYYSIFIQKSIFPHV